MVIAHAKRKGTCETVAVTLPLSFSSDQSSGSNFIFKPSVVLTIGILSIGEKLSTVPVVPLT